MHEIVLPIFVLIAVGYALRHFGVLRSEDAYRLVDVIIYATFPATIFLGLVQAPLPPQAWKLPLWSWACMAVSMLFTWGVSKAVRLDRPTAGALIVASAFGNTGFLGVPLSYAAFGSEGRMAAIFTDLMGVSVPLYTLGFAMLASFGGGKTKRAHPLTFFRTPMFLAAVLAVTVRAASPWWSAHFDEPSLIGHVLVRALESLSGLTATLAMLALGVNLRMKAILEFGPLVGAACLAKIILMPLTAYWLVHLAGPPGVTGKTCLLQAAMPGGLVAGVVCGRYHANARLGAAITVGTTLASLVTLAYWGSVQP